MTLDDGWTLDPDHTPSPRHSQADNSAIDDGWALTASDRRIPAAAIVRGEKAVTILPLSEVRRRRRSRRATAPSARWLEMWQWACS